ncbi:MAG: hypothetical protein U0X74_06675 [Anaerolineales bacterium]
MYTYPIKFEFPMISLGRQVDVKNGDGKFIMRASDPFISFKDSMSYVDGSGKEVYRAEGDSSFRFMFQFASMSTEWNVVTSDGKPVAYVDDYWARMEEFKDVNVNINSSAPVMQSDGRANLGGVLGNVASNIANNVVNYAVSSNVPSRLVYQIKEHAEGNVLGWIVPSRGTGWFDFLPYSTRIQILNLPFAARAYAPSYEFKIGNLYGPTVLKLQKQRDLLVDKYTLEKVGEMTDQQERWAIPALTLVAMFERTRVKQMADW